MDLVQLSPTTTRFWTLARKQLDTSFSLVVSEGRNRPLLNNCMYKSTNRNRTPFFQGFILRQAHMNYIASVHDESDLALVTPQVSLCNGRHNHQH